MIRPDFIPPNAPPPLLDLMTGRGLRRAAHLFGVRVATGGMEYGDAVALLMQSYVVHVWTGAQHWRIPAVERRLGKIVDEQAAFSRALLENDDEYTPAG